MYRVAGYAIMALIVVAMFRNTASVSSPVLIWSPIVMWVGNFLTNFKQKLFPMSRAENIFSKAFEIIVLAILVLFIIFWIVSIKNG